MKHVNIGGWNVVTTPFPKLCSTASRHGGQTHAFLPLLGNFIQNEDGSLKEGTFSVIRSATKGTILITDRPNNTEKILLTVRVNDGFRGSSGLHSSTSEEVKGQILAQARCSSNCEGQATFAVLLHPGQKFILYESGRRTDRILVYENQDGELIHTTYTSSEYLVLTNLASIEEDGEVL